MTNSLHAADGTPEPELPHELPTDDDHLDSSRTGVYMKVERLEARAETLRAERDVWRARAKENQVTLERQKAQLQKMDAQLKERAEARR
ncbi:hypothetical protein [Nesterenkonia marinintestina]|uniref:hypothetical protein n=1 Tax=Nesterenkonia marinintestina TaxID=2979865 RepID=UPI0021C1C089|nr:hypothetical protein [Nesterenkonia sp. GX14115]